jgi:hypothetical protein
MILNLQTSSTAFPHFHSNFLEAVGAGIADIVDIVAVAVAAAAGTAVVELDIAVVWVAVADTPSAVMVHSYSELERSHRTLFRCNPAE